MYDIASGKSRTAYAIAYDGTNYTLILANVHYIKIFKLIPSFLAAPDGISANQKGDVIIRDPSNTYKIQNNLTLPVIVGPQPNDLNVIGYEDTFIYFWDSTYYIYKLKAEALPWGQIIGSFSSNSLGMFKGLNSQIFIIEPDGTNLNFYSINNPSTILFLVDIGTTLSNPFGGLQTKSYFYVWTTSSPANSIFRITTSSSTTLNSTTTVGNSLMDVTVTDNDKVFAIAIDAVSSRLLKQVISDNNYPEILYLGSDGIFNIDSLDDRHIIISSSGNTYGYNGLTIYDVEDKKIVKHITSIDIIAMDVLR
ncbi:MAG: hypothetical protein N3F66_13130 [Spirochaetes bacterium]|nr:hypothetical protein [Spirochaetota bacterium]